MTPAVRPLESRQLLSAAVLSAHEAAFAQHRHGMRLHHAAIVERVHSSHHGADQGYIVEN
jgi:hypothetical protein